MGDPKIPGRECVDASEKDHADTFARRQQPGHKESCYFHWLCPKF